MSNVILNTKKLMTILEKYNRVPNQNIMLVGKHGIGKSEILTKFYQDKGKRVISFFLGQMSDPGDLIGLPRLDESTGRTEFAPPFWFPTDGEPVVLFLDELNRARPEILQVIMDLALNKKLAGRSLPEGSQIISAINGGQEYNVTELEPALKSRFNIYDFNPSVEEWLDWARKNELDERVIGFIQTEPQLLDGANLVASDLEKTPDRRAWKKVSDFIKNSTEVDEDDIVAICGMVGVAATSAFNSWLKEKHLPAVEDVLLRFTKNQKTLLKLQINELSSLNDNIFAYLDTQAKEEDKAKLIKGLTAYVNFLADLPKKGKEGLNKSSDPLHNFESLYMDGRYEKAESFISMNCSDLTTLLIQTI